MRTTQTFSILFWLKTAQQKEGQAPIYARVTVDGKRSEISLKRWHSVTLWDARANRSKARGIEAKQLNHYLDEVYSRLLACHSELSKEQKLITAKAIKARYLGEDDTRKTLLDIIRYHNDTMTSVLKQGTLKNYKTTEKYLKEFLNKKLKTTDIPLQQISYSFVVDFEQYLKTASKSKLQSLNNNGIMKHLERLKKLLNLAVKLEWTTKNPFANFKMKFTKYDRAFLTKEELQHLEDYHFKNKTYQIARDVFVFSCYTGLSYIDVKNLTENHMVKGIDGREWIYSKREKSQQAIKIPVLAKAQYILSKYETNPKTKQVLPVYSNQKLNQYLKEIAAICKIDKHLSFHVARHTFATTVTLSNGVPIETVSKLLGHSKLSTTQIYARVVERKLSEDMEVLCKIRT